MHTSRWLSAVRERRLVIVALTLAGVGVAAVLSLLTTPQYRAGTTVFLSVSRGDTVSELNQGAAYTQNLVKSFSEVATTPAVLDPVIRDLRLDTTPDRLARVLTVELAPDTVLVTVSARSPSPQRAAQVANAVGTQLARTVGDLSALGPRAARAINVTTVATAEPPAEPFTPRPWRDLPLGLALGLLAGLGAATLAEFSTARVRTEQDLRAVVDLPVLATVRRHRRHVLLDGGGHGPGAESYKSLRTNLLSDEVRAGGRSVVVTSATQGDGTTTTAVNMAITVAAAGVRVLLVEADLRRPSLARSLNLPGTEGLSAVLRGEVAYTEVVQSWGDVELEVLPAGRVPTDPSELLGSPTMALLLADLGERYDLVVLDTPAATAVTDAAVLGRQADGVLLVVDSRSSTRAGLETCLDALELAGGAVLGMVLNRARSVAGRTHDAPPVAPTGAAARPTAVLVEHPG